ncbi:MAG: radical SAM protein [Theionarchaea archaeon]|nr:radical SAM protein [Theionarchaea archaeon]
MKHIRKGLKIENVKRAIKLAKEVGFKVKASFILGLPYQKPDEAEGILKFVEEAGLQTPMDLITINMLCPFPGTDLYDNPGKYGITITNKNWTLYNGLNCVTESATFPRDQLIDSYMEIVESNFKDLTWSTMEYGGS